MGLFTGKTTLEFVVWYKETTMCVVYVSANMTKY